MRHVPIIPRNDTRCFAADAQRRAKRCVAYDDFSILVGEQIILGGHGGYYQHSCKVEDRRTSCMFPWTVPCE